MERLSMRRNTVVLFSVLIILALFAWAGWANWEYRQQKAEQFLASYAKGELVPSAAGTGLEYVSPLDNKPAPGFALEDLNGRKVTLASYRGKVVLVNFWATWCAPCKVETPWLIELRNKYEAQGFEVLGISTEGEDLARDDKAGWAKDKLAIGKFVEEEKISYPVLLDGDSISKPYGGLDALPMSFFVDRKGTVVATQAGVSSESEMEAKIRKAMESRE
jgi:thiol-disulfide isomerase/thioredoxin